MQLTENGALCVFGDLLGWMILLLALTFGYLLRGITRLHWVTAVCQAGLLNWLILPVRSPEVTVQLQKL